jgi:hypothetical protein
MGYGGIFMFEDGRRDVAVAGLIVCDSGGSASRLGGEARDRGQSYPQRDSFVGVLSADRNNAEAKPDCRESYPNSFGNWQRPRSEK